MASTLTMQRAVDSKPRDLAFDGAKLTLQPKCAIFITVNPGFARNLKTLFRTVAMVPDYTIIGQIALFFIWLCGGELHGQEDLGKVPALLEQLPWQD
ncbi:Dynein heavy chain 3, axonemal [Cladochytrium tenue]|nr:Dynein heavy chain 3, axonemal [Cladochytrium tenue]